MSEAISSGQTPNLFLLRYRKSDFKVSDVLLIPHFAFSSSMLEKCKPLSPNAKRAGWIGCNFLLDRIATDARIGVIREGIEIESRIVREKYKRLKPLEAVKPEKRGWTLDVLNAVRSLGKSEFVLDEVYNLEDFLAELHPKNSNVRPKIRQQLQVLRDLSLLTFLGDGCYRLV